ncbi:EAL domain-containing protein [Aeromicrobium sp. SMF47]|uniref:putative bifunctional diguanylate cyclase/phosphodiesterase n=1 Tax=Aeromicrobium TaxID=2040 RepID=UPI00129EAA2B|nr:MULTISPECIES: EAL domain-containing protein [Aeromicrobium]MRJ77644.1 EAL domain-containing protein [Aeromicrobium yanjiei]MRK02012.1 EAL domain-containing protein [Aeromicrobium sp. S22]
MTSTDFEAVFRAASTGFVLTAADGTIVEANDWFSTWTGLGRAELLGTSFLRLLPVGDRIVFSTRTAPLLDLAGRVPEIAVTVLGADRVRLPATLGASRVMTEPDVTLYVVVPRRERSFEETQLISAVHRAEDADARRRRAEEHLARVARHDTLTGLLNRTGVVAAIADRFTSLQPGQEIGACWIGLDHFRVIVESLGRAAGDDVLNTIARRLGDRFGEGALVGRVGGDEFVVALREGSLEAHADSILALVAEPMRADDLEIVVSASIGLATGSRVSPGRAGAAAAAEALLQHAGTGMHAAKAAGRNRWKRSAVVDDDSGLDEIRLLGEIRTAIAEGQLRLEYQPQLDLRTGGVHGFEALVRWDHPDRGPIAPSGFIQVAEKSGLISQIGTWACATAIAQAVELTSSAGPVQMSVNISARQLGEARFADTVLSLLRAERLDPGLLTLELTETGLITDAPQVGENVRELHEHGVQLSIDDFGTGHASFAYLNEFPIDEIKIDKSYVDGLDTSPESTAIVVSCIELAHALSVAVVAEGVETPAQLSRLTELGCDIAQGYLYSRPLRAEDVAAWLTDHR